MIKEIRAILLTAISVTAIAAPIQISEFESRLSQNDGLGFRALLKSLKKKDIRPDTWLALRDLIERNSGVIGFDLLYAWDRISPTSGQDRYHEIFERVWKKADQLSLNGQYAAAFKHYQRLAQAVKKEIKLPGRVGFSANLVYPYILQSISRALYSMGDFKGSYETLGWISPSFPRYRQVLYERMWAAFNMGRVDLALGAIAAQRSAYFSQYLEPEAYLVELFVYKKLCREGEVKAVVNEIKTFRSDLSSGKYTHLDWAKKDFEDAVLARMIENNQDLLQSTDPEDQPKRTEYQKIQRSLLRSFEISKKQLSDNLNYALAYARMSGGNRTSQLAPVEKLPSRVKLFELDLEIWPADSAEEWIDEIGTHRFLGESECVKNSQ